MESLFADLKALSESCESVHKYEKHVCASRKIMLEEMGSFSATISKFYKDMKVPSKDLKSMFQSLEDIFPNVAEAKAATSARKIVSSQLKLLATEKKLAHSNLILLFRELKCMKRSTKIMQENVLRLCNDMEELSKIIHNVRKDIKAAITAVKAVSANLKISNESMKKLKTDIERITSVMKLVYIKIDIQRICLRLVPLSKSLALKSVKTALSCMNSAPIHMEKLSLGMILVLKITEDMSIFLKVLCENTS